MIAHISERFKGSLAVDRAESKCSNVLRYLSLSTSKFFFPLFWVYFQVCILCVTFKMTTLASLFLHPVNSATPLLQKCIFSDSSRSPEIDPSQPDLGHIAKSEPISVSNTACILPGQTHIMHPTTDVNYYGHHSHSDWNCANSERRSASPKRSDAPCLKRRKCQAVKTTGCPLCELLLVSHQPESLGNIHQYTIYLCSCC